MKSTILRGLAAALLAVIFSGKLPAAAQEAVHPNANSDDAQPVENGWVRKTFDFGSEDINFQSLVPPGATVETVALGSPDPDTIGKIKIVGKIQPVDGNVPVEVTITAFDLVAPAAASRVCAYEIESAGYTLRSTKSAPDLSDMRIFATKSDGSRPMEGAFSQCFTRGNKVLALHFIFDVSKTTDLEAADALVAKAQDYANTMLSHIAFTDGKPTGYGAGMKDVPISIGTEKMNLSVPNLWNVAINDFHGPLPAELHLVRRKDEKSVGAIWLAVREMKEQPDLDELGKTLIRDYFVLQSLDAKPAVPVSSGDDPAFTNLGVAARNFRFSVEDKSSEDAGDILATLIWHEGRLYVVSVWSIWAPTGDRNIFFSRLPGLTAYDLITATLSESIAGQR
ncbi:hypothetical protein ABFT80_02765 [Mesorhizobium sp. SB112]|uniref:hypothetical protein n=1 Tax=Mesorhizobium sp. SB112 TaxID=3151853 RepID=UPI003266432A